MYARKGENKIWLFNLQECVVSEPVSTSSSTKQKSAYDLERRIKCDENRPDCLRCSTTGRKCDGYRTPSPSSKYHHHQLLTRTSPPSLHFSENDRETRSFQFFYERTAIALAGYCSSEFWSRLVLQVSQHEKSIWHALIALGSLHENFEMEQVMPGIEFLREKQNNFAIREYLLAINALLRPADASANMFRHTTSATGISSVTLDVCLISCILFTCFEILSGHYGQAINHVRSGMGILGEVSYDPNSGTFRHPHLQPSTVTRLEIENIRIIFTRLQIQASTLTRADVDLPAENTNEIPTTPELSLQVPECFASVAEARDIFETLNRICAPHYSRIMRSVPVAEAPQFSTYLLQQYGVLFHKWCMSLTKLEQSRGEMLTAKERMGLKLLNISKLNTAMYYQYAKASEAALFSSETEPFSWDHFNIQFAEIVSLAASVVETTYDNSSTGSDAPVKPLDSISEEKRAKSLFSLDNGIVGPLYNVATLCRDPIIRRRAVHVLRSARRQEGIINSFLAAIVAEKVIEIEERAALGDISDYQSDLPSLSSIVLGDMQPQNSGNVIKRSSDVPNTARLMYAYPKFDTIKKEVFLTIGQSIKADINIPLPAMNFLVDT